MKCRFVPAGELVSHRLDADYYICPTKRIDQQIARAEASICRIQVHLEILREKRKQILREVEAAS